MIAAAGFHNLLLIGSKGAGKTMIANRIPTLFPALSREEGLEISRIYSAAGLLTREKALFMQRPFVLPIIQFRQQPWQAVEGFQLQEKLRWHIKGYYFWMNFPNLKEQRWRFCVSLEAHKICISRVSGNYDFPAVLLVGAMNPCPCGYYPDRNRCSCTQHQVEQSVGKLSGPLFNRFDLCTEVADIPAKVFKNSEERKNFTAITSGNLSCS